MGMQEYRDAVMLLQSMRGECLIAGPQSLRLVEKAEEVLGIMFPPTYRTFLLEFGAITIGAHEIYGIIDENFIDSAIPDGIWFTLIERRDIMLPKEMVVIYVGAGGELYCLDGRYLNNKGEYPIILYRPEYSPDEQVGERVAGDFGSFLYDIVKSKL